MDVGLGSFALLITCSFHEAQVARSKVDEDYRRSESRPPTTRRI